MTLIDWLEHPAGRLLTLTLLHFLWQGFAVALGLVVALEFGHARKPATRYACSLVALLLMAFCPIVTFAYLAIVQSPGVGAAELLDSYPSHAVTRGVVAQQWLEAGQPLVLTAWLAGVAVLGSRLLSGALGVARLRHSRLPVPPKIAAVVERLGKRLQFEARSLVYLSHQVADAMAVGLIGPLVLIPAAWATEMPVEMLEAVIAHELAHLRRRDLWVNLLQRIVETLLFYHPAVWWLSNRLRIERELCADELAIAATGKRLEYARTLEQIASEQRAEIRPALATFLRGDTNMRLLERVRNVLGQPTAERSRLWPAGLLALALPLGLWAASALNGPAVADDDRDEPRKPAVKRERDGERREGDRGDRGDRVRDERREEAVITRVGDKVIVARKGDEPRGRTEQREERYIIVRDGEPPQQIVRRRVVDADGKLLEERELGVKKDRGDQGDRRLDELTAMVKRLAQQVERLQGEVSQLRGQKPGGKEAAERKEQAIRSNKFSSEDIEADQRKLKQAAEQLEQSRRAIAEKQKALADMAEKLKAAGGEREVKERVLKELTEKEAVQRKRALEERRAAIDKAHAAQEKAEAARDKAEAERERKRRESDDDGEAKEKAKEKEKAAREKADAVKKQIQLKLQKLKEGKVEEEDEIQFELTPKVKAQLRDREALLNQK